MRKRTDIDPPQGEDFDDIERRLRESRPQASEAALARAHLAAAPEEPAAARRSGPGLRRTRLAITGLLATGVLLSGTGAALGIAGINSNGSAGSAQYVPPGTGTNTVLGTESVPSSPTEPSTPTSPTEPTTPTTPTETTPPEPGVITEAAQTGRQEAATGEKQLPFTGLAAFPIILCGVVLLGAGAVLRWRSDGT